jgi:hypothetical protein
MLWRLCIRIHRLTLLRPMLPCSGGHDAFGCLSGKDLSGYEFISATRQGFVPVSLKLIDNRFNIIM